MSSLLVAAIAAIASLFSLAVGASDLRVTLGIVVLIVALHTRKDLKILQTATVTGIFVFLVRLLMDALGSDTLIMDEVYSYAFEILFYVGYGLFYKFLVDNEKTGEATSLLVLLMLCDFGANSVEYFARYLFMSASVVTADFMTIFLAAFIRSAIIWLILKFGFKSYQLRTPA